MPEIKKAGLSVAVIISATLGVSSCSSIPMLDGSPVSDNMKYRSNDASIKALSIPPELSKPAFDDSYALNKPVDPAPMAQTPVAQTSQTPMVQQSSNNASVMSRGSSTQDLLNSQDAPTQAGTVAPVVQAQPAAPAPVVQQTQPAAPAPVAQTQAAPVPVANTTPAPSSRTQVVMTKVKSGEPALAVNAPVSQTWPRLSQMLPRVGFEVTKQQPQRGIYTIVYKGNGGASTPDRGLLSRLWTAKDESSGSDSPLTVGETYLVLLVGNANKQSFVGVRNSAGKPADPAIATHVLGLLKGQYEL